MQLGKCTTIKPVGPGNGILTGRFLMVFMASLALLLSRGFFIANIVKIEAREDFTIPLAIAMNSMLFMPQFLLALWAVSTWRKDGIIKMIFYHCDLILLPMGMIMFNFSYLVLKFSLVTFFTFSTQSIGGGVHKPITYVGFRKSWTLANMMLSTVVLVGLAVWYDFYIEKIEILKDTLNFGVLYVVGIITTLISLFFDKLFPCCCYCWKGEGQFVQFNPNISDLIRGSGIEQGIYDKHFYDTVRNNWRIMKSVRLSRHGTVEEEDDMSYIATDGPSFISTMV